LRIDCLYELFATYLSRGLFRPRLIFARINGPIVSVKKIKAEVYVNQDKSLSSDSQTLIKHSVLLNFLMNY
jgi:hypothetical protein